MARVTHLKVKDGDTLEYIAAQYLGSASRWPDIVVLNQLRHPFVSKDHTDQLGPILARGTFTNEIPSGSLAFELPLLTSSLAVKHGSLHVHQIQNTGALVCDTLTITAPGLPLATGTTQLSFSKPTKFTYLAGTEWVLFPNSFTITTKVLKPGDTVILPDPHTYQEVEDETEELAKLLGADIELNQKTKQLVWDSKKHDFAIVSGVGNMNQALRLRLSTALGELIYHRLYGNRLLEFVGQRNTAVFIALAAGIIHQCVEQDIRVYSVEQVKLDAAGDVCRVDFAARIKNVDLLLEVKSLGLPI